MLAMHYAIPLKDAEQVAAIRIRAAERGPLFDRMDGLAKKLFLVDPVDPCYATFYLWRHAEAALGFLEGPFFKALSDSFGRPDVKLLLTTATELPFASGEALRLQANAVVDTSSPVRALDPHNGDIFALAPADAAGRYFEVMYRATGPVQ